MSKSIKAASSKPGAITDFLHQYGYYVAFVTAMVAMLGSLYFSEIKGFIPCTLCWYQRILMYPLTVITLVGIIKEDDYLPLYVLPFSILGIFVSSYHYLLQTGILSDATTCSTGIPCSLRYINYGGFVTISLLALTGFIIITVVMFAAKWANSHTEEAV